VSQRSDMTAGTEAAGLAADDAGEGGVRRADEAAPPPPLPPVEIAELFSLLDKAVRSQRLYQPNNPVYRSFIDAAGRAFRSLWDGIPVLTAAVEERAFVWYGRRFAAGEGRECVPFLFYKDGVRFVTFLPGFEDELETFLEVVNRARTLDQDAEDDMVTLLWQQEFSSFQYSYVDSLAEGLRVPQSTVPKLAGLELTLVPDDRPGAPPPERPPPAVAAGEPPVAGLVSRADFAETLYFLDAAELAQLRAELEREWQRDVRSDVLDALFDRLADGTPEWRSEIIGILRQLLPLYLGAGDLQSATRVLVELSGALDANQLDDSAAAEAHALLRELSDPRVLLELVRAVEAGSIDPAAADLSVFLRYLGPAAMPVLLAATERTSAGAVRDRLRTGMEGLAAAHQDELVELLSGADPDVLRGAARIAGRLALAAAGPPLTGLLAHPDAALRRTSVEALTGIRTAAALDAVQHALADEDRDVRLAAVRGLAALRYQPARARIEAVLRSRALRDADITEKIAFFEAYGSVADMDGVGTLDRLLNGRRLLGRQAPEMRACAAMALGRVNSPAARTALQRASDDANPVVRSAVLKALRGGAS
jgi:hypothetical protein